MENSRKKLTDKLMLAAGIIIFLALMGGSIREYREYRQGVENINKTKANLVELQGRKERLQKLREKLWLVKEGEEYEIAPTSEPKVIDLRMEEKPMTRKMYWGEWWKLLR